MKLDLKDSVYLFPSSEIWTSLHISNDHLSIEQVYTDAIRRAAELHGVFSPEVYKAMHNVDDVLQAILTDIRSKEERANIKVRFPYDAESIE